MTNTLRCLLFAGVSCLLAACATAEKNDLAGEVHLVPGETYVLVESVTGGGVFVPRFCNVPEKTPYQPGPRPGFQSQCNDRAEGFKAKTASVLGARSGSSFDDFAVVTFGLSIRQQEGSTKLNRVDPSRGGFFLRKVKPGKYFPAIGAGHDKNGRVKAVDGVLPYFDIKPGQVNFVGAYNNRFIDRNNLIKIDTNGLEKTLELNGLRGFKGRLNVARPEKIIVTCKVIASLIRRLDECQYEKTGEVY